MLDYYNQISYVILLQGEEKEWIPRAAMETKDENRVGENCKNSKIYQVKNVHDTKNTNRIAEYRYYERRRGRRN